MSCQGRDRHLEVSTNGVIHNRNTRNVKTDISRDRLRLIYCNKRFLKFDLIIEDKIWCGFEKVDVHALSGEHIFEVKGMVDAFDDAGAGIYLGDAAAEFRGSTIAFGDEDSAGAPQVGGRLAQRAARQQVLVAKGLLVVNQHHIMPPAPQVPVLKAVASPL
jgi:hypothetical protein